jgi:hypothetical protein
MQHLMPGFITTISSGRVPLQWASSDARRPSTGRSPSVHSLSTAFALHRGAGAHYLVVHSPLDPTSWGRRFAGRRPRHRKRWPKTPANAQIDERGPTPGRQNRDTRSCVSPGRQNSAFFRGEPTNHANGHAGYDLPPHAHPADRAFTGAFGHRPRPLCASSSATVGWCPTTRTRSQWP